MASRKTREAEFLDRLRRQKTAADEDLEVYAVHGTEREKGIAEGRSVAYSHVLTLAEGWFTR